MDTPTRLANLGLAALAIVAAGTTGYAVWSVRQPPAGTAAVSAADLSPAATDSPGTTQDATTRAETDDAGATEGADVADDAVTSAPGPGDGEVVEVSDWVQAWSDEADLLVLGDGYSNLPEQWLQLWATQVAQERPVTISHWGEAEDISFNDPITLSEVDGPPLAVWSASRGGTTIAGAAERLGTFAEAAPEPDAVLLTLGRSSEGEDIPAALDELVADLPDVPVLLAVGPTGLYAEGVGDALADWAQQHPDEVALVDLREDAGESPSAEEWATAFDAALDRG